MSLVETLIATPCWKRPIVVSGGFRAGDLGLAATGSKARCRLPARQQRARGTLSSVIR